MSDTATTDPTFSLTGISAIVRVHVEGMELIANQDGHSVLSARNRFNFVPEQIEIEFRVRERKWHLIGVHINGPRRLKDGTNSPSQRGFVAWWPENKVYPQWLEDLIAAHHPSNFS